MSAGVNRVLMDGVKVCAHLEPQPRCGLEDLTLRRRARNWRAGPAMVLSLVLVKANSPAMTLEVVM